MRRTSSLGSVSASIVGGGPSSRFSLAIADAALTRETRTSFLRPSGAALRPGGSSENAVAGQIQRSSSHYS
jgi:hypothetical protein